VNKKKTKLEKNILVAVLMLKKFMTNNDNLITKIIWLIKKDLTNINFTKFIVQQEKKKKEKKKNRKLKSRLKKRFQIILLKLLLKY